MKIKLDWNRFEESEVSQGVRMDIMKTLRWIERADPFLLEEVGEELLAQSMINIYLQGVQVGLKMARVEYEKAVKGFGHGGK